MKKFTLLFAAALVTLAGSAQVSKIGEIERAQFIEKYQTHGLKKQYMNHLMADQKKLAADRAVLNDLKANAAKTKVIKKAGEAAEPNYCHFGYNYSEMTLFMQYYNMYAAFASVSDDEVSLDILGNVNPLTGKILKNVANRYSETGADSIVFENGQLVGTDGDGNLYYYRSSSLAVNSTETGYDVYPTPDVTSFGGYYFPESGEIYIPWLVGVYGETETTPLEGTVYGNIDAMPVQPFYDAMLPASIYMNSYWSEIGETTQDGLAIATPYGFYVMGASFADPSAWLSVDYTEADGSMLAITDEQLISTLYHPNYNYARIDVISYGAVVQPNGYLGIPETGFGFFAYQEDNGDIVLESDGATYFAEYGASELDDISGLYGFSTDMQITIGSTPAAIKGVTDNMGEVSSKEYFDISGRKIGADAKGLVIEKTRYANGKTVSRKVLK